MTSSTVNGHDDCVFVDKHCCYCGLHDIQMYIAGLVCMPNGPQSTGTIVLLSLFIFAETAQVNIGYMIYQILCIHDARFCREEPDVSFDGSIHPC